MIDYWFCRLCCLFAHFTFVIANSTGCNPTYTRMYYDEWQEWVRYFELLDVQRRNV